MSAYKTHSIRKSIRQILRRSGITSISFLDRQSINVMTLARRIEIIIKNNPIFLENTKKKTLDTEIYKSKVVTSAAIPNDLFRLRTINWDTIKTKINTSTGYSINRERILVIISTYFIYFI